MQGVNSKRILTFILLSLLLPTAAFSQVPRPADVFGFQPGTDYKLATYDQMLDYYRQLDAASDRVQMREIGTTVLGRKMILLIISSKDNMRRLGKYRRIGEQLARARIDESSASKLVDEGKSIVWIDGGLHATEVAHAQMTPLLAYRVATEESDEMRQIRENTILLLMPVMNPDGLDIVASWYKKNLGTPYETTSPPWLYHNYVGHDNNRDWFMNNMPESRAVTEVLYNKWYPQIVYNHHQTGPSWTRIFLPPFASPVNPNIHPGITTAVNLVGSAMANRFAVNRMPGVVSNVIYSMWWNGGMRTVPYFHNMVGILTETSHASASPRYYAPDSIPSMVAGRGGGGFPTSGTNIFYPYPWKGGESHLSDPIRYMMTASMAVLRLASDRREQWLENIYRMGRDAIEEKSDSTFAYIIPAQQWNQGEELSLVNILRIGGIEVERTTESFVADGREYPEGSYVAYTAQAFRPYLKDLMEKQDYPDRRSFPGGPPDPPYDLAGWTLPIQMGVRVVRAFTEFKAAGDRVLEDVRPAPGSVSGAGGAGYLFSHRPNAGVLAANRLLKSGRRVFWLNDSTSVGGENFDAGTYYVEADSGALDTIEDVAADLGLDFVGLVSKPDVSLSELHPPRVGLYKSWRAVADEGWTRWLLERYDFAPDTLHDSDIRQADLSDYDAIILPSQSASSILNGYSTGTMPDEYVGGLGLEGAVALERFAAAGGTLIALDAASDFAIDQFGLSVANAVKGLPSKQFFIPGSLVRMNVDTTAVLGYGMQSEVAAVFDRSRAFRTVRLSGKREGGREDLPSAPALPVESLATYAKKDILMSGWALGEEKNLGGKSALMRVAVGEGEVILFGFRPQFRGQPRGTYKLLFNALQESTIRD